MREVSQFLVTLLLGVAIGLALGWVPPKSEFDPLERAMAMCLRHNADLAEGSALMICGSAAYKVGNFMLYRDQ